MTLSLDDAIDRDLTKDVLQMVQTDDQNILYTLRITLQRYKSEQSDSERCTKEVRGVFIQSPYFWRGILFSRG